MRVTPCSKHGIHFVSIDAAGTVVTYSIDGAECHRVGDISPGDLCFDPACLGLAASGSCCDEGEAHVHAHLKMDGCVNGNENSDGIATCTKKTVVKLMKKETMPATHLQPQSHAGCDPEDVQITNGCGQHEHGDGCGHFKIMHGEHVDYLVPQAGNEKNYEMHHACRGGGRHCHIHGVLRQIQSINEKIAWFVLDDFCPACTTTTLRNHQPRSHDTLKGEGETIRTTLYVTGICCPSEVPIIERLLTPLPGVTKVAVNVTAKTTIIDHDSLTTAADLVLALNSASMGARIHSSLDENSQHRPKWNVLLSGLLWAVSVLSLFGKPDEDGEDFSGSGAAKVEAEQPIWPWADNLKWVAIAAIAVGWPPILKKAFGAMRTGVLDINMLMTLAVIGAIAIGDYVEGAAVVFLFALSEWLETRAGDKARVAIAALMLMKPQTALHMDNTLQPVEQVPVGTRLKVLAGSQVPLDGTVVAGSSTVDESNLTGESQPVAKTVDDFVSAGTMNQGGYLEIISSKLSKDSCVFDACVLRTQNILNACCYWG